MNERNKKFIKAIKELEEVGITYGYEKHREYPKVCVNLQTDVR